LEVFPESEQDGSGFVQFTRRTPVGDFFFLDTLDQGKCGGLYCERRCEWLRQRLQQSDGRPVYLFMHHPPFDIGIRGLDAIRLMESESFAELIADYRNIKHLFFGHVHRPVSGSWRGIPFSAIVSTNHQVAMDFEAPRIIHSGGDPGYNVVLLDQDLSVIHMYSYVENPVWLKRDTAS
jgi:3',5'-cyclic AMP phosphodiesterase CpdA